MVKAVGRAPFKNKFLKTSSLFSGANAGKPGILAVLFLTPGLPMYRRTPPPISLQQAAEGSPTLGSLMARARDAAERLKAVEGLIPPAMRAAILPGPAEGDVWCLLVKGSAAAAKLRQLSPMLVTRLKNKGWDVAMIRIKLYTGGR
jgi:hypothetical protein